MNCHQMYTLMKFVYACVQIFADRNIRSRLTKPLKQFTANTTFDMKFKLGRYHIDNLGTRAHGKFLSSFSIEMFEK